MENSIMWDDGAQSCKRRAPSHIKNETHTLFRDVG